MKKSVFEVTIIGLGNVGFRYLEGILKIEFIKKINLIDTNLDLLKSKLLNIKTNECQIYQSKFVTKIISNSDLVIVSTTSNERYEVCKNLQNIGYFGDLILEKFLFPDSVTLEKSENLFSNYPSRIFVNQWMRKTLISNILNFENIHNISIQGENLGLLCNAVHFIDLVKESLKINDFEIDSNNSFIKKIIKAKRKGYLEICGRLVWKSKIKNLVFSLEDKALGGENRNITFLIKSDSMKKEYILSGQNLNKKNSTEKHYIPYLSEHSKDSIIDILNNRDPQIPNFKKSLSHHRLLLNSLCKIMNIEDYKNIRIT